MMIKLLSNVQIFRYESNEDKIILEYIEKYKPDVMDRKFADLASILNRTRASVWRRYRILQKKKDEGTDKRSEMIIDF